MAKLPPVLSTDDLALAELCAARIDGELVVIDEAWAPVDEPDLPSLRASAIGLRAPRTLVIERFSAAWVHDAIPAPPHVAQFCVSRTSRVAVISAPRLVIREVSISDADIIDFRHARCTTVARTGFDLLREPGHADPRPERVVAELCARQPLLIDELRARFAGAVRMPHRALALERLARIEAGQTLRHPVGDARQLPAPAQPSLRPAQPSLTR
ncbi:hypothetical protein [Agromyces subbeticus]|uniref:hypothetical protein n=1 Tax=Agromyces subbeticus TaxID=293890 RepID=UPI0012EB2A43|nr:hypothetical protein [Agromyces subbeticus]